MWKRKTFNNQRQEHILKTSILLYFVRMLQCIWSLSHLNYLKRWLSSTYVENEFLKALFLFFYFNERTMSDGIFFDDINEHFKCNELIQIFLIHHVRGRDDPSKYMIQNLFLYRNIKVEFNYLHNPLFFIKIFGMGSTTV